MSYTPHHLVSLVIWADTAEESGHWLRDKRRDLVNCLSHKQVTELLQDLEVYALLSPLNL